jgi:hypothetical protein
MTYDDFEQGLRHSLATLAREAIPDDGAVVVDDLPKVQPLRVPGRRVGTRAVAAVLFVVLMLAVVVALVTHGSRTDRVETNRPVWTKIAAFPLLARSEQTAVFTGHEVIVWGGRSDSVSGVATPASPHVPPDALADGAAYDVARNHWGVLPPAPVGARYGAVAAWTGSEMLVVGGMRDGTGPSGGIEFLRDGAAYDPVHRRWRRMAEAPGCPAFGAWTGKVLVVGGTCANTTRTFVMAAYDPARNVWTTLPSYADATQLVSAGGTVFAWSGSTGRAAVLDSSTKRWSVLPQLPDGQRMDSLAAPYNGRLAVAGLLQRPSEVRDIATVDVFDLNHDTWRQYESIAVTPILGGSVIASAPDALVWSAEFGYSGFVGSSAGRTPRWLNSGPGPGSLGATGESLVAIGGDRFFVWGGLRAGTPQDATNRPTPAGAILRLP